MFLVLATAASGITEFFSRMLGKRAKDLERTLGELLAGSSISDPDILAAKKEGADAKNYVEGTQEWCLQKFGATSIWRAASSASKDGRFFWRKIGPSYISAKAFAEAVTEMLGPGGVIDHIDNLPNLKKRLESLVKESGADLIAVKAGLERWFDEAMERLQGTYKRWATLSLFLIGFILAGLLNASTLNVAVEVWKDPVTRQTVADSASKLVKEGAGADQLSTVADAADKLQQLGLPLGWGGGRAADFLTNWHWTAGIAGWVLTALLVMLGAPFWFDLLSRLVNLRNTGPQPAPAAMDKTSATGLITSRAVKQPAQAATELSGRIGDTPQQLSDAPPKAAEPNAHIDALPADDSPTEAKKPEDVWKTATRRMLSKL
jgi:hypothetical protein